MEWGLVDDCDNLDANATADYVPHWDNDEGTALGAEFVFGCDAEIEGDCAEGSGGMFDAGL